MSVPRRVPVPLSHLPLLLLALAACAPSVRSRGDQDGSPAQRGGPGRGGASQLLDPSSAYRQAGLIVQGPPLEFVGGVRYLGGHTPDSTLVLVTLSLANRSLTFSGGDSTQRASYGVILDLRRGATSVNRTERREVVRVSSFRETTRRDESIIFQQFLSVAPGAYTLSVTVRDEGGANAGEQQIPLAVPALAAGTLSSPVVVYQATARTAADSAPELVANPRATVTFGRDSFAVVYLEGYHLAPDARVAVRVSDDQSRPVLHDTITAVTQPSSPVSGLLLHFPVPRIGAGRFTLAASLVGATQQSVETPLLVSVGDQLGIMSFDELVSYLRYYASPARLAALRNEDPARRAAAWTEFWEAANRGALNSEQGGLREYFARIQTANNRFREEGGPGWLTDRGKVYITLGEPDRIMEQRGGMNVRGRALGWEYTRANTQLIFIDQTGFGRWRLTPSSESQFQMLARSVQLQ